MKQWMMYLPLKRTERNVKFIWVFILLVCLVSSCTKSGVDCSSGYHGSDLTFDSDIGVVTDSSLALFPNNLPLSSTFKNNFNQINKLAKSDLKGSKNTYTYRTDTKIMPCYEYKEIYTKSVKFQFVNFDPISPLDFYHRYSRTRYIEYQNYLNLNPKIRLDSTYEMVTLTLNSPFNSYAFIVPIGKVKDKLTNYTYSDTITLSGISFNNIYHIFADSSNYNPNKVVPQGLYYNENEGLVGYYLSSGEVWVKQ